MKQNNNQSTPFHYTIRELASLAGISTRTLRYYDQIGLLPPACTNESGYRMYGSKEVDRLQEILFYREFGMPLSEIRTLVQQDNYNRNQALSKQLDHLLAERRRLDILISNLAKTMKETKGATSMTDKEKFEGFKKDLVKENEECYGAEARTRYGGQAIDESNAKIQNLTESEYTAMKHLEDEIKKHLEEAVRNHADPAGEAGAILIQLHRDWLSYTWKAYSEEAHLGLAQLYTTDPRFTAYYDEQVPGCAAFLAAAAQYHLAHTH